jgi:hypothetical protein
MPTLTEWQQFANLRIAFGHQSVGFNVLEGIDALAKEQNVLVSISETQDAFTRPAIHHFRIGRNEEPTTKLAAFDSIFRNSIGSSANVAMMKFCFVDFGEHTDPAQLAQDYINELDKLTALYPDTRFVPLTAPLTTVQTGAKAWLKKLTGRAPAGYAENARRETFNDILRAHYAKTNLLFDIAALESRQSSNVIAFEKRAIQTLDPELTADGGHLNAAGERLIGAALVRHLAGLNTQP